MRTPVPIARPAARGVGLAVACLAVALAATACRARTDAGFSIDRATRHVRMLATQFGSRPTGSEANRRAREYVADQLRQAGFTVRLQGALSTTGAGLSVPVINIIAVRPGRQREAIALVSHYDSPPQSRGAADDGLGVAVCLEAGRVLAARPDPRYSLLVAITDSEELDRTGARALAGTPEFKAVRAFLNFEAVGTTGPARLFQAGPGNAWLPAAWAAAAPFPSGSSLLTEIYHRLPNGTDSTVLKEGGAPGLDFAPTGNQYAYHTPLDTPSRLETATIARLGANAIRLVDALDSEDIRARTAGGGTFFDVAGRTAFAYSGRRTLVLAVVAFVLGLLAAYKAFRAAHDEVGTTRLVITAAWSFAGVAVAVGSMWLGCALLRLWTGLEQPWFAGATLLPVFLSAAGLAGLWLFTLAGRSLPVTVRPSGAPSCIWMVTLPAWAAALAVLQRTAPGAGYLFAIPLLVASALVLAFPIRRASAGRAAALVTGVVAGVLWLPLAGTVFEFMVALFGRMPVAPPSWFFPVLFAAAMATVAPCAAMLVLERQPDWLPSSVVTSVVLLAVVAASWVMAVEPAYTRERPERRVIRYVEDLVRHEGRWEAATHEAAPSPAGTAAGGPAAWRAVTPSQEAFGILRPADGIFHYEADTDGLVQPPLEVSATLQAIDGTDDVYVETTVRQRLEGTGAAFVLPAGVVPAEASLRGVVRDGRWRALVMPVPASGLTLRVRVPKDRLAGWSDARVLAAVNGVPGGVGWQRLPPWLAQDTLVWEAQSVFILPWTLPAAPAAPATPMAPAAPGQE